MSHALLPLYLTLNTYDAAWNCAVFRMGNCLELSQKALEALSTPHHLMRLLGVSAQGFKAIWLILDHIIWFGKVDIIQVSKNVICWRISFFL